MYTVEIRTGLLRGIGSENETIIHTSIHITHPDGKKKEAWGFHPADPDFSGWNGPGEVRSESLDKNLTPPVSQFHCLKNNMIL